MLQESRGNPPRAAAQLGVFLRPIQEIEALFRDYPGTVVGTIEIAERCTFDLIRETSYVFPDYAAPGGLTPDAYLEKLCYDAAKRRYGDITPAVRERLGEEFRLIRKYKLAGFLLLYHEVFINKK